MSECVNHPDHYKTGKFECIEIMKEIFGEEKVKDFCKMNAFKYLWRSDRKNGDEDLKKAKWYLDTYLLSELLNDDPHGDQDDMDDDQDDLNDEEEGPSLLETLLKGFRFVGDMSDEDNEKAQRYAVFEEKVKEGYPERVAFWMAMTEDLSEDDDEQ